MRGPSLRNALGGPEYLFVAAAEERQRALFVGLSAAGDRRVQKLQVGFEAESV
jgi:hypothetical protein